MAFAMLTEIPDLTRAQYESVVKKVNESGSPAGAIFHTGGPIEGGYRVFEVWETREAADTFYGSDVLRQATSTLTAQLNIIMTWPVFSVDDGSGWKQIV